MKIISGSGLSVIYLLNKSHGREIFSQFVETYKKNTLEVPADLQTPHVLHLAAKGFDQNDSQLREWIESAGCDYVLHHVPDEGYDIGTYLHLAREMRGMVLCFLNSYAKPLHPGWLRAFHRVIQEEDIGVVSATGSLEGTEIMKFPNPHVRTNAFMIRSDRFIALGLEPPKTKHDAHLLECGPRSITKLLRSRGLRTVVVNKSGAYYDVDGPSGSRESCTFRWKSQSELLVSDNRTDDYQGSNEIRKRYLEDLAWGVLARGADLPAEMLVDPLKPASREATDSFHRIYYDVEQCFHRVSFLGTMMQKYPTDLFSYLEIIFETRPKIIIECGTNKGGSALFFASMIDIMHARDGYEAHVISIDIEDLHPPKHPRITHLLGSSTDPLVFKQVVERVQTDECMVILDSDHAEAHVLRELNLYAPLVTGGMYLIVEDTNVNGHPVNLAHGPGPFEAVARFVPTALGQTFEVDRTREKLLLTANPCGYLRKKAISRVAQVTPSQVQTITILGREEHVHAACFDELAEAVQALARTTSRSICFNAHSFPDRVPQGSIVYNLENVGIQLPPSSFSKNEIWDFSMRNLEAWRSGGRQKNLVYVPVGYHSSMERFDKLSASECEFDIVFAGSLNERRIKVLDALRQEGLSVCYVPHTSYGSKRDELLARSRILLNFLYYESGTYPTLRSLHAVANKICVVSEDASERPSWCATNAVHYDDLVSTCLRLVREDEIDRCAHEAYEKLKCHPMVLPAVSTSA